MTYLIFDIVIVLLLLLAVLRGYRRGFVLALCGFLAVFVAFIGATVVSNALAEPMSHILRPAIQASLQQVVDHQPAPAPYSAAPVPEEEPSEEETQEPAAIPLNELLSLLKDSRLYRGFADAIQKAVDEGQVSAAANATRIVSDYIAKQVAHTALFLISFLLILVLWFFLSHALDLAFKLPVLSTLNAWAGALLGLFKGVLLVYIACWLSKGSLLPQNAIEATYLLRFFCTVSPLTLLS